MKKVLVSLFLAVSAVLSAQEVLPIPEGLEEKVVSVVFSSDTAENYSFSKGPKAALKTRMTENGRLIYDVEVFENSKNQYGTNLRWNTQSVVKKGDRILARMTMRTLFAAQESGECEVHFYFQTAQYAKAFIMPLGTDAAWKTFDIPVIANRDYSAGSSIVELGFGALRQHVEITDVEILNFGPDFDLNALPETSYTYKGREEGAQWRKDALARIEEIRTAPIKVKVLDEKGRPVKGAEVNCRMTKSDFLWGTAVNEYLLGNAEDSTFTEYRRHLLELFNAATLENGLKARGWDWQSREKIWTIRSFEWLYANDISVRGHNLVWPGWKFNNGYVREIAGIGDKEMFDSYIKGRFYERMAYTKGRVVAWDVINEMLHERDLLPYLPETAPSDWFKLARQLDPEAQLFINDYNMLTGVQSPEVCNRYISMIEKLLSENAPIDGIGIQGHIGQQPRSPEQVLGDLDLFNHLGLPIQITEFDIETDDEQLQADYTRDFLIAVYSHPSVTGVILWGFWESRHWKRNAAMFRTDWSVKPNGEVWRELVTGEWKTDVTASTAKDGMVSQRGHFGEYEITITYKGKTVTKTCHLDKSGQEIIANL